VLGDHLRGALEERFAEISVVVCHSGDLRNLDGAKMPRPGNLVNAQIEDPRHLEVACHPGRAMRQPIFHPAIEGLRGLSVLAVMLFHTGAPLVGGGFLGVSTFFTLSGFLITGLLVAEREGSGHIRLGGFWGRRLRRLMPAALAGLALILALGSQFGDAAQRERLGDDGLAALLYVANWQLIATDSAYDDLMGSPSWVQHFWSLAIEEQYYAAFPLAAAALLAWRRRWPLALLLTLGCVGSWSWLSWLSTQPVPTERLYYGTDTRVAELLIGGLLALALSGRSPSPGVARPVTGSPRDLT
jgi:peptidoglycan/LPS O-acetylase OafA/YrhL